METVRGVSRYSMGYVLYLFIRGIRCLALVLGRFLLGSGDILRGVGVDLLYRIGVRLGDSRI